MNKKETEEYKEKCKIKEEDGEAYYDDRKTNGKRDKIVMVISGVLLILSLGLTRFSYSDGSLFGWGMLMLGGVFFVAAIILLVIVGKKKQQM